MKSREEIIKLSEIILPGNYLSEKIIKISEEHSLTETEISALAYESLSGINVEFCIAQMTLGIEKRKKERNEK